MLRLEAGRNPHDKALIELVGELSTQSELFRQRWASQDVRYHRSGRKRLRHPVVGQLDLDFEALELPSEPGLQLNVYTAAAGTPDLRRPQAARLLGSQPGTTGHRTRRRERLKRQRTETGTTERSERSLPRSMGSLGRLLAAATHPPGTVASASVENRPRLG